MLNFDDLPALIYVNSVGKNVSFADLRIFRFDLLKTMVAWYGLQTKCAIQ